MRLGKHKEESWNTRGIPKRITTGKALQAQHAKPARKVKSREEQESYNETIAFIP